jgi:hypothetical protein
MSSACAHVPAESLAEEVAGWIVLSMPKDTTVRPWAIYTKV